VPWPVSVLDTAGVHPDPGADRRAKPPNLLLLITDQQRAPQHWPEDPDWLRALTPADHELARTGLSFDRAFCASCMCSPSRATLFTGTWPARHGVPLTLTAADLKPDPRNLPAVISSVAGMLAAGNSPRRRIARQFVRGAIGRDPDAGNEPELRPGIKTLGTRLRDAGYHVVYKGKWHLTQPLGAEWGPADSERIEREFGFAGWEPPDAGENAKAENFGGGNAGTSGEGWDEDYTAEVERWLGRDGLPEPFCLIVSLVNPHDVLGYPNSFREGGYRPEEFRELGVRLPATVTESLANKPAVHELMRLGMTAYLGPLRGEREQLDYVNFYAHLHRLVDEKIGRVVGALGEPTDPSSLRSRTVIVRCADHGEMGLAHGGLRQKAFNAYEETIRVPLIVSNPVLFPEPRSTGALATLADVTPTLTAIAGVGPDPEVQGADLGPILGGHASPAPEALRSVGADLDRIASHPAPAPSVRAAVHFTYDDHQAGTALTNAPGQPNRVRAVREEGAKYAVYLDPDGHRPPEYELYDLDRDPLEIDNLVDHRSGEPLNPDSRRLRDRLTDRLEALMDELGTRVGRDA
jgi:choline-sulfatase